MDESFSLIQFLKEINPNDLGPLKSKYITKKADASEAFILQTDLHAPLHYVLSTLMDADGKPLAFVQSYMDGKQVSLHSNPVFVK
jgi:DNA-binding GntR family transcriptional regulator